MSTSSLNMEKNRVLKPFVNSNVVQDKLKKRKEIFEAEGKNDKKIKTTKTDYFTLNTGDKMPIVQFGTYKMKGEECYKSVLSAIKMGYKGLDTASVYDNEGEVGRALVEAIEKIRLAIGRLLIDALARSRTTSQLSSRQAGHGQAQGGSGQEQGQNGPSRLDPFHAPIDLVPYGGSCRSSRQWETSPGRGCLQL